MFCRCLVSLKWFLQMPLSCNRQEPIKLLFLQLLGKPHKVSFQMIFCDGIFYRRILLTLLLTLLLRTDLVISFTQNFSSPTVSSGFYVAKFKFCNSTKRRGALWVEKLNQQKQRFLKPIINELSNQSVSDLVLHECKPVRRNKHY